MRRGGWRLRPVRRQPPAAVLAGPEAAAPGAGARAQGPWPEVCEQFAWRLLVLAEQLRPALDNLEEGETDPDRLARLYEVDHGVTRIRRVARDLRVLAGGGGDDVAGHTTSLLDVIRMAASAIEHYDRVAIGPVADLALVPYAADDIACVLAALADNATRYSPAAVTVSAHLLADGGVMLRVEDAGLGIEAGPLAALNEALDEPVPADGGLAARHTGFAVVHRLARRHGLRVQLARRQPPGRGAADVSGTLAMVVIPAPLLCEIPGQPLAPGGFAGREPAAAPAAPPRAGRAPALAAVPASAAPVTVPPREAAAQALPRREPASVRTPAHAAGATPARGTPAGQAAVPAADPAAEGLAFAVDLQAYSAALGEGQPAGTGMGGDRPRDTEGHGS
jgi:hypothetical protein